MYRLLKSLPKEYETIPEIQRNQKEIPPLTEETEKLLAEEQSSGNRNTGVDRRPRRDGHSSPEGQQEARQMPLLRKGATPEK